MLDFPIVRSELGRMTSFPKLFDSILYVEIVRRPRPSSIFVSLGHRTSKVLHEIMKTENLSETVLWVGGSDRRLTAARHYGMNLKSVVSAFKTVYWEAMNKPYSRIRPAPTLFTDRYMKDAGYAATKAVESANVYTKTKWLFSAWGHYQPQLDRSPNCKDRGEAVRWVNTHANESWLDHNRTHPTTYWATLAEHRFSLSPSGLGLQSSKTFEAIATLTVPICHRSNLAYVRLAQEGWPLVIVDTWDWVTLDNMTIWWHTYAPNMVHARRCMNKTALFENYISGITMRECIDTHASHP
jgi:hypothetical protein